MEHDLELKINKAINGFILEWVEDIGDDEPFHILKQYVVAERDYNHEDEIWTEINIDRAKKEITTEDMAMYDLLHAVMEHFEHYRNKHRNINLEITFEDTGGE
jgi:hypothetical protein